MVRCWWAKSDLYIQYHDTEWGVPVHDDRRLFEFLILEGAQAGLSWETIHGLRKTKSLLADPGIVRNRLKIESAIQNAGAFLAVCEEAGTFDKRSAPGHWQG